MLVTDIYKKAIELGIQNDLRGTAVVERQLKRVQKQYEGLSEAKKKDFDTELLTNPYPDTRILHDNKKPVKKIMVGIDIGPAELLLAQQMGDIDLVIAHHPVGRGLSDLSVVMQIQAEILHNYGVPINIAEHLLKPRISEVARGVNPINHYRSVDFAQAIDMSFMCVHTPCDNLVATFLKDFIESQNFTYVSEVIDALGAIPEYKYAIQQGLGPVLFAGSPEHFAGKIAITEITGGTEGTPEIYEHLSRAGVGTIIGMHMSEKHKKAAEAAHINALIAGHMSSDSIGVNLFIDELAREGVEIVPISGLIRVERSLV